MSNERPDFITKFDLSGRAPRDVQVKILNDLADNWHNFDVHVVNAPTGSGKSAISRAIQAALGAHIITPQNILVDQYSRDYPQVNFLKGATWYQCHSFKGMTCAAVKEAIKHRCSDCAYDRARARARNEPTFFNPMSLYYARKNVGGVADLPVMVVDEAHSLLPMMQLLLSKTYKKSKFNFNTERDTADELSFMKWLRRQIKAHEDLMAQYFKVNPQKALEIHRGLMQMKLQLEIMEAYPQQFVMTRREEIHPKTRKKDTIIDVAPLRVPLPFLTKLLGENSKLVLLSGSIFPLDVAELLDCSKYKFYDVESPFPVENRKIIWKPLIKANFETPIEDYLDAIRWDLEKFPDRNTLIHVTYDLQQRLYPLLHDLYPDKKIWVNTQEDKSSIIQQFKEEGGILLGAGCSEGIDLPDNTCRLNIVLKMEFPNLQDPVVAKRLAVTGGQSWYRQQALKSTIQRYGRSTRSSTDWSTTVVHDPLLVQTIRAEQRTGTIIPTYFLEAIECAD